jgi:hypothetical protein
MAQDVYDGSVIRKLVETDRHFGEDARHAMLSVVFDPFRLFGDDAKRSASPCLVSLLNLKPQHRWQLGVGAHVASIAKMGGASEAPHADHDSVMELLVDELDFLERCERDKFPFVFLCFYTFVRLFQVFPLRLGWSHTHTHNPPPPRHSLPTNRAGAA